MSNLGFRWTRLVLTAMATAATVGCGPPADPEVVATQYVRAVNTGDPDTAVGLVDIDEVVRRVEEQVVIVQDSGNEHFLRDSVQTVLWGLFRESVQGDFTYVAAHAEVSGDNATVAVKKLDTEGEESETVVHLRRTERGWRVSGQSLDTLIGFVIQRLEERY